MVREYDDFESDSRMMKSGYQGKDSMRDFARKEFGHPNFDETERPMIASSSSPTRDKVMPFKKGGAVKGDKGKKSKLNDLREFKTAKMVSLKKPKIELEMDVFPAPGLKGPKQEGMKKGGPKSKKCKTGGPITSRMESKHPVRKPLKKGGPKKKMSMGGAMTNYAIGGAGKVRHKQATAKGAPLKAVPRSKAGR